DALPAEPPGDVQVVEGDQHEEHEGLGRFDEGPETVAGQPPEPPAEVDGEHRRAHRRRQEGNDAPRAQKPDGGHDRGYTGDGQGRRPEAGREGLPGAVRAGGGAETSQEERGRSPETRGEDEPPPEEVRGQVPEDGYLEGEDEDDAGRPVGPDPTGPHEPEGLLAVERAAQSVEGVTESVEVEAAGEGRPQRDEDDSGHGGREDHVGPEAGQRQEASQREADR